MRRRERAVSVVLLETEDVAWFRDDLTGARSAAGRLAGRVCLGEQRAGEVVLAASEAASNLAEHALAGPIVLRGPRPPGPDGHLGRDPCLPRGPGPIVRRGDDRDPDPGRRGAIGRDISQARAQGRRLRQRRDCCPYRARRRRSSRRAPIWRSGSMART